MIDPAEGWVGSAERECGRRRPRRNWGRDSGVVAAEQRLKPVALSDVSMQVLSLVGPGASAVVDDLATRLDGRVATVDRRPSVDPDPGLAVADGARFSLDGEGNWNGAGTGRSFDALLDSLAPDYDYALVAGVSKLRLPTVVLADADADDPVAGDVVARAETASDLDLDSLVKTLDDADPFVTLETLVTRAKQSPNADRCGAIATFTGRVRARDAEDDDPTTHLEFEKYEGVAEQRMAAISAELEERDGVFDVRFHHRTGVVADGEDIVFVVVLAGHRTEAFRTVEDGINRLKDEVPLFKKETTAEEEFWVHDRTSDR
jgi:molybdopterin synthase catalytic subunit